MSRTRTSRPAAWPLLTGCLAAAVAATTLSAAPSVAAAPGVRVAVGGGGSTDAGAIGDRATAPGARVAGATYTIAAAGDVACEPDDPDYNVGAGRGGRCRQRATSDLLLGRRLDAILVPGDLQYDKGQLANFERVYDRTWGRVKSRTRPVPGNHEYDTRGAAGYYDYFGSLAGPRGKGFYSFDLGTWHIIGLNSECYYRARCASEQERWLRADLARDTKPCQIAYWHRPRFSSGHHGNDVTMNRLWKMVSDHKVEVVLNGHDHDYERFGPMNASGKRDPNGVREFVVGMGGKEFRGFTKTQPVSEVRDTTGTLGVLFMTLKPNGYDWRVRPIAGRTFTDSGSGSCH